MAAKYPGIDCNGSPLYADLDTSYQITARKP